MTQYAKGIVSKGGKPQINGWSVSSNNRLQYNGKNVPVGQLGQQVGGLMPGLYGTFGGKPFQQLPQEAVALINSSNIPVV
jgi:hypothetical protein